MCGHQVPPSKVSGEDNERSVVCEGSEDDCVRKKTDVCKIKNWSDCKRSR